MLGGLFLEIGVLAAGHLVQINLRRSRFRRGIKRPVQQAHLFPIIGKFVERAEIQLGITRIVLKCGDDGIEIRLAG